MSSDQGELLRQAALRVLANISCHTEQCCLPETLSRDSLACRGQPLLTCSLCSSCCLLSLSLAAACLLAARLEGDMVRCQARQRSQEAAHA